MIHLNKVRVTEMNRLRTKQGQLFLNWNDNEVHTLNWFRLYKISNQLIQKYLQNGLIKKLGGGAYIKSKNKLDWQGAIFTIQKELKLPIHIGGRSALDLNGSGQYLNLGKKPVIFIIMREKIRVPVWLKNNDWGVEFRFKISNLFNNDVGLEVFKKEKFNITLSSRERAIMEMIDDLDLSNSFETLEEYFEGLINIRSDITQKLLESCNSIKVKRVFLYMLEYFNLPVVKKLNIKRVNLGSGKRVIVKNGEFNKNFNITVPRCNKGEK